MDGCIILEAQIPMMVVHFSHTLDDSIMRIEKIVSAYNLVKTMSNEYLLKMLQFAWKLRLGAILISSNGRNGERAFAKNFAKYLPGSAFHVQHFFIISA